MHRAAGVDRAARCFFDMKLIQDSLPGLMYGEMRRKYGEEREP